MAKEHHDKRVTPTARDALKHENFVHGDFHAYRKGFFRFLFNTLNLHLRKTGLEEHQTTRPMTQLRLGTRLLITTKRRSDLNVPKRCTLIGKHFYKEILEPFLVSLLAKFAQGDFRNSLGYLIS